MSYQAALVARVIREGQSGQTDTLKFALDQGIEPRHFTELLQRHAWTQVHAYYTAPDTRGSVPSPEELKKWAGNYALAPDMPNLTKDGLVFQVQRELRLADIQQAMATFATDVADPLANPRTHWEKLTATVAQMMAETVDAELDAKALFAPPKPSHWAVESLGMAPGAPTMIAGYGSSMKSFATSSLAICLAAPDVAPVWGMFPRQRRCRVLLLDYEQGAEEMKRRVQRLARDLGVTAAALDGWLTGRVYPTSKLAVEQRLYFERAAKQYDVIIIDSFAAARDNSISENDAEVRAPLDMLAAISEETGCLFIVVHHSGKGSRTDKREVVRGSSAIFDACSNVLAFERLDDGSIRVTQTKCKPKPEMAPFTLRVTDSAPGGTSVLADVPTDAVMQTMVERSVVAFLETEGGSWKGSREGLKKAGAVNGKNYRWLGPALKHLAQTGRVTETPVPGTQKKVFTVTGVTETPVGVVPDADRVRPPASRSPGVAPLEPVGPGLHQVGGDQSVTPISSPRASTSSPPFSSGFSGSPPALHGEAQLSTVSPTLSRGNGEREVLETAVETTASVSSNPPGAETGHPHQAKHLSRPVLSPTPTSTAVNDTTPTSSIPAATTSTTTTSPTRETPESGIPDCYGQSWDGQESDCRGCSLNSECAAALKKSAAPEVPLKRLSANDPGLAWLRKASAQ